MIVDNFRMTNVHLARLTRVIFNRTSAPTRVRTHPIAVNLRPAVFSGQWGVGYRIVTGIGVDHEGGLSSTK